MDFPLLILISLIIYIVILLILKLCRFKEKIKSKKSNNCCPVCNNSLERTRRTNFDHLINFLTFQIFEFKRYFCSKCLWKGLISGQDKINV